MKSYDDLIKFYEDRITFLEGMLQKSLEVNKTLLDKLGKQQPSNPFPPIIPHPDTIPRPFPEPYWNTNNCPKCGLKLEGTMGYVCSNNPCPTGLGGVYCSTKDTL